MVIGAQSDVMRGQDGESLSREPTQSSLKNEQNVQKKQDELKVP